MTPTSSIKPIPKPAIPEPRTDAKDAKPATLYRAIVFKVLDRMSLGRLRMMLPDGSEHFFGDSSQPVGATLRVRNDSFFRKCVLYGDVGFGEAFVDADWDTDDITAVIRWLILNVENAPAMSGSKANSWKVNLLSFLNRAYHLVRPNSVAKSRDNIREHYDLGNDFYSLFLDSSMTYSSGLFLTGEEHLTAAQEAKYERLCRQLKLQASDHVLEIGGGWGGFCCYAAKRYGCRVTAVTISEAQLDYASKRAVREGVDDRVRVVLKDYRHITGQYDKIVSIEMLEAVGDAYFETYFAKCSEVLKKDGLLAIQMITCPDDRYDSFRKGVDWIQKHIFPGSLLPSIGRVNKALNKTGDLFLHDLRDMGTSYTRTLQVWRERFNANLDGVREQGFTESFIRKWNYYLSYCEAAFGMRNISVVQAVYTRPNNPALMGD